PRVFKPLPRGALPGAPPFCIEPDPDDRRDYIAGERFGFGLKLFSYALEYLPFFVQAIRAAGEKGMGRFDPPGKFALDKVECEGESLYDAENDNLTIPAPRVLWPLPAVAEKFGDKIAIRLATPLRHKSENRFSAKLEFVDLFHLVLRRLRALALLDGEDFRLERDLYERLREKAFAIRAMKDDLSWRDWTRYSSRQDAAMRFGGLMGSVEYEGDLAPFANFLRFAEIAHLGKQTSFGLGRLELIY
ncbi:MAG: CRISPR system precrRNA processing endoribonuclease RAMP protein Cas6, partial [Desulfovibrio sp.]|nr:CRISPR system precrRNA processing endoribonuclease RAMP protein Cas6 [Desulfovibrio sp.]